MIRRAVVAFFILAALFGIGIGFAAEYAMEQPVLVEWHGTWYKAKVIGFGNGCTWIHYDGYSSSWDECVGPHRIKPQ